MEPGSRSRKLAGRVEHVASGRTATFESVKELPELLRQMLEDAWKAEASVAGMPEKR